jgi:ABC-type bacteriocin/lantibiotic exporter with double-glycine peptidase domain
MSAQYWLGALALASLAGGGCYAGSAHAITPHEVAVQAAADPGWVLVGRVPLIRQRATADCGAAALAMVLSFWTTPTSVAAIDARDPAAAAKGWRAGQLRDLALERGLDAFVISAGIDDLTREIRHGRPVVVGVVKRYGDRALAHYQVVVGINPARGLILSLDPADGWREDSFAGFDREWMPSDRLAMMVLPRAAAAQRSPGAS